MFLHNINNTGASIFRTAGITQQGIPTPDGIKLTSRQYLMWISKPGKYEGVDLNLEGISQADFTKKYFASFGTVAAPPVLNGEMIMIAGNVNLFAGKQVLITNVMFQNFSVQSSNAAAQTLINDSLESPNAAIPQARFDRSPMAGWAENFFRPEFRLGGTNLFHGLDTLLPDTSVENSILTDWQRSIGMPLPLSIEPNAYGVFGTNFDVKAHCYLPVKQADGTYIYQQIPLVCVVEVAY